MQEGQTLQASPHKGQDHFVLGKSMPLNKSSSKRKTNNLLNQNKVQGSPVYYLDGQVLHHHYDNGIT